MEFAVKLETGWKIASEGCWLMLKITNLNANVENKSILKSFSLNINPGEVHAIMGPNGSGKSTLSNILSGKRLRGIKVKFYLKIKICLILRLKREHITEYFWYFNIH